MNTITVSYNYPVDFLWGINPEEDTLSDMNNSSYLFKLQEKKVTALLLNVKWARCEPLKGQFDEVYIESLRSLLARIKNRNIQSIVILNGLEIPIWKNLDHPRKSGSEFNDTAPFYEHLAEALFPYTNYFGIYCPRQTLFNHKMIDQAIADFQRTADIIHSLSEKSKAGLILPDSFGQNHSSKLKQLYTKNDYHYLRNAEIDFLGLPANRNISDQIQSLLGNFHKPLIFISNRLRNTFTNNKSEPLADILYEIWRMYQKGWKIIGYLSETEITSDSPDAELYEVSCKNNALKLSTDMSFLSEKWIRFLKD